LGGISAGSDGPYFVILNTARPGDINYRATKMRQPVFYSGGRL
jgi:hypothetical protein